MLYEATAVSYFSGTDDSGRAGSDRKPCVTVTLSSDQSVDLSFGTVFVTNEAGKTVAAYRFD